MGAHRWSGGAGEAFAVLGAGAGFGHGRTVGLLPLEETRGKRGQGVQRAPLTQRGPELELTRPGSSQHLSLLAHTVLQAISNIWSWNWRHTSMRVKAGRAGALRADRRRPPPPPRAAAEDRGLHHACDPPAGVLLHKNLLSCCFSSEEPAVSTRPHRCRVVSVAPGTHHPAQDLHAVRADVSCRGDAFLRHRLAVDHHFGAGFADGHVQLKTSREKPVGNGCWSSVSTPPVM